MNRQGKTALISVILVIVFLLCSGAHAIECDRDDCPICLFNRFIMGGALLLPALKLRLSVKSVFAFRIMHKAADFVAADTPVSLSVLMLD